MIQSAPAPDAAGTAKPRLRVPAGRARASASTAGPPRRSYAGAGSQSANIAMWQPQLKSADADMLRDAGKIRARARDLCRNHPYAQQAVRASRLGVIGKRVRYSCRPDYRFLGIDFEKATRWGQEFERVWETYAHGPGAFVDAGRRMNFTQLMALQHDCLFRDGESLAGLEWDDRRKWRTCLKVVDVDRLSNPDGKPESVALKAGVALDALEAPVGYWIRNAHPGDSTVLGARPWSWSYSPRETPWGRPVMTHTYEIERPGQTRGISALASVLTAMKQGAEYTDVALQQAILQASYAAVLVSQMNYKDALEVIAGMDPSEAATVMDLAEENLAAALEHHEKLQLRFQGSQIPVLWPGEDLKIISPGNGAAQIGEFQAHATKSYAAGAGVDPIQVSQDYSQVNYSSAKMAAATSFRHYEVRREILFYQSGLPVVGAFLEEIVHAGFPLPEGIKPAEFYDALPALIAGKFLTQGAPMLDPVKERQGQQLSLAMGVETLQDIVAEDGGDYIEKLEQQAREMQERMSLGLPMPMLPGMPPAPPSEDPSGNDPADGGDGPPAKDDADGA